MHNLPIYSLYNTRTNNRKGLQKLISWAENGKLITISCIGIMLRILYFHLKVKERRLQTIACFEQKVFKIKSDSLVLFSKNFSDNIHLDHFEQETFVKKIQSSWGRYINIITDLFGNYLLSWGRRKSPVSETLL